MFICVCSAPPSLPCSDGPYVWDQSTHTEGIGSNFQWRKYPIILANKIGAKYVGTLENEHDLFPRDESVWFGLNTNECTATSIANATHLHYIDAWRGTTISTLCSAPLVFGSFGSLDVLVVPDVVDLHEDWNYCTFDPIFRKNFWASGVREQIPRPANEFWITVHLRWGDVATGDVEHTDGRTWPLSLLAYHTQDALARRKSTRMRTRVFLLAEDLGVEDKQKFLMFVPEAEIVSDSSWKYALAIIANSNVTIGGSSSFFAIGSHLCHKCTVITEIEHDKFKPHEAERALSRHMKLHSIRKRFLLRRFKYWFSEVTESLNKAIEDRFSTYVLLWNFHCILLSCTH